MIRGDLDLLTPPIFGVSPAGWTIGGDDEVDDLFNAGPDDDLTDWRGMVIYDSASRRWYIQDVWRVRPESKLGVWVYRLLGQWSYLDVKLSAPEPYSETELRKQITATLGPQSVDPDAASVREILERL